MKIVPTSIEGCYRIQLEQLRDARGHFTRVLDLVPLREVSPAFKIARVNRSLTQSRGAIRGLHYQRPPRAEDKIVQCLAGRVFDVCVDLREDSKTRHHWVGFELSPENEELLWIPRGCAHGFQTLTEGCLVEYFCTEVYSPADELGARWNDPRLGIEWPLPCTQTSEKDATWPMLAR
jgi:dTDP-4-dehydrorhamnose 3,5-epimerase